MDKVNGKAPAEAITSEARSIDARGVGVAQKKKSAAPAAPAKAVKALQGSMHRSGHVLYPFQTPILARAWPDSGAMNTRLRELILERRKADKGVVKSNAGGAWHSSPDFFRWPAPEAKALSTRIAEAVKEATVAICGDTVANAIPPVRITGWANILNDRGYNRVHNHPDAVWSGVYYVDIGKLNPAGGEENGAIEFLDPRAGAVGPGMPAKVFGTQLRINPKPGLMLLFPSWLHHWVHPYNGEGERISIAFNIQFAREPKPAVATGRPVGRKVRRLNRLRK